MGIQLRSIIFTLNVAFSLNCCHFHHRTCICFVIYTLKVAFFFWHFSHLKLNCFFVKCVFDKKVKFESENDKKERSKAKVQKI